jgi:pyrimidine operon attenuation protein/uracil phosphoribosyltransferase
MTGASERTALLDASAIARALERIAQDIVTLAGGTDRLVLVGIQRRGVELADRIGALIRERHGATVERGALDITLYRDDLNEIGPSPVIGETRLPHRLDGRVVVIVDDVLFTGRTIRAALDQIADFGRPARIGLAVLIDRGGRELPIQADIVGERVTAGPRDRVDVRVTEVDGRDAVELVRSTPA